MRSEPHDRHLPAGQALPAHRSHTPYVPSDDRSYDRADRRTRGRERSGETPPDHRATDGPGGVSRLLKALPLTFGLTALSALAFLTLGAATACRAPDPAALVMPMAYGALGLSSLLGGILAGRRSGPDYWLGGLLSGGLLVVALLILSLLVKNTTPASPWLVWLSRLLVILLHLLGSYLSRPREKRPTHRSGHRR